MTKKKIKRTDVKIKEVNESKLKTVLILRVCNADMGSSHGFTWPESGHVEAPDWKENKECGNGLHGWLWGEGDHSAATWGNDMRWLVVETPESGIVNLNGKVKFPCGEVVFCGDQASATRYIQDRLPSDKRTACIIGGTASAGYRGTASAGYLGTASAGDRGTASAGDRGTASAGDRGTASAGDLGTASAGDRGTASAGDDGVLTIRYHDGKRWRIAIGYVGEDGVKKNTRYQVKEGKLVEGEDDETKRARERAAEISAMKTEDRPW